MKLPKRGESKESMFCPLPHPVDGGAAVNDTNKQEVARVWKSECRSSTGPSRPEWQEGHATLLRAKPCHLETLTTESSKTGEELEG